MKSNIDTNLVKVSKVPENLISVQESFLVRSSREIFRECLEIMKKKNHDYSPTEDPFGNFRMYEHFGICSIEEGILTRMIDKISRIITILNKNENIAYNETVEDTLIDLINYSAILLSYIRLVKR